MGDPIIHAGALHNILRVNVDRALRAAPD